MTKSLSCSDKVFLFRTSSDCLISQLCYIYTAANHKLSPALSFLFTAPTRSQTWRRRRPRAEQSSGWAAICPASPPPLLLPKTGGLKSAVSPTATSMSWWGEALVWSSLCDLSQSSSRCYRSVREQQPPLSLHCIINAARQLKNIKVQLINVVPSVEWRRKKQQNMVWTRWKLLSSYVFISWTTW